MVVVFGNIGSCFVVFDLVVVSLLALITDLLCIKHKCNFNIISLSLELSEYCAYKKHPI